MAVSKAQRAAADRYRDTKDKAMIYFPKGTADAIRAQGESVSGLCCRLVAEWLTARGVTLDPGERAKNPQPERATAAASDTMIIPTGESDAETLEETPTAGTEFPPLDLDLFL